MTDWAEVCDVFMSRYGGWTIETVMNLRRSQLNALYRQIAKRPVKDVRMVEYR